MERYTELGLVVPIPINLLKGSDLAYIAGLFDTEVAFMIIRKEGTPSSLVLTYTKTNRKILDYLSHSFGGKVYSVKKRPGQRLEVWVWRISSGLAYRALRKLYPFLRIKKETAYTCMNFYEQIRSSKKEPRSVRREIAEKYALLLKAYQKKPHRTYHEI